jgi:hypothetical protein
MYTLTYTMVMPLTGVLRTKRFQFAILYQYQIVGHGSINRPESLDAGIQQLAQRTAAYPPHHDGINLCSPQGHKRLTVAVGVVQVLIVDNVSFIRIRIHNNKIGSRSKMVVDRAVLIVFFLNWKSDFHLVTPFYHISASERHMRQALYLYSKAVSSSKGQDVLLDRFCE